MDRPSFSFLYDVVCPYAYLASTQVEALAARTGARLQWDPVLLGGILRSVGAPDDPNKAKSAARTRVDAVDLHRLAERLGVPLRFPDGHPRRTVDAMRLLVAASDDTRPALSHALYRAYWVEGRDVADRDVLSGLAREHGIDPGAMAAPEVKQGLFDRTAAAVARGVFGVPAFLVGDDLYWGVDRMEFVENALTGAEWTSRPPPPRSAAARSPRLAFFFDFSSPWSYHASTQVERVAAAHGAALEWVPILLGALFRDIGTPMAPFLEMNDGKRRYTMIDFDRWARRWGVPFRFTSSFPLRTVTPLRVALIEPRVVHAVFRAAWAEDRNIGDDAVLEAVLDEAGFDGPALIGATQDAGVKDRLKANTARAREAGACGVPTFLVNDEVLLWGQDRFDQVEAALDGWRP